MFEKRIQNLAIEIENTELDCYNSFMYIEKLSRKKARLEFFSRIFSVINL